ncbi:hypothetical protein ILUMI_26806 [Ignelater luminosus]|uniref:Uncharacterized protein n=1 Tax=Ignelater luminosus TaxID=2038154 RepID=A0A8K0FYS7_IGNLU|nr:hypothetical protein ILUMI_26806 [Ignelater luminosus]
MGKDKHLYLRAFEMQKKMMTLSGLWPKEKYGMWYNCYGFIVSLAIQAIFLIPSVLEIFSDSTTATEVSYELFSVITLLNYGFKVIILYIKTDSFRKILVDLEQPLFTDYEDFNKIYIKKAVFISVSITKLLFSPCIIFIIFLAAFPVIDSNNTSRPLPYDVPIDIKCLPFSIYVVIYFIQIIAVAAAICNNVNIDILANSLIALATAQLQILEKNIRILVKHFSSTQFSTEVKLEDYTKFDTKIRDNVRTYVRHHIAITE